MTLTSEYNKNNKFLAELSTLYGFANLGLMLNEHNSLLNIHINYEHHRI